MTARLADIARAAGVSEATVSRVLNAKPTVAEGTRQAVLTALDVLGYERPSKLRRSSVGLVGLITPELTNPIFPAFAQEIETLLARSGYTPVLGTQTPGGIHEDDYTEMLLERQVSGIIFVSGLHADSTSEHLRYEKLIARGLPIVLINGFAEDIPAPFVSCADSVASELAVQHLSALGHRRIGLAIGPERFVPAKRKILGFRQAMASHCGLGAAEPLIAVSLFTVEGGQVAATKLLDSGCTAIVCGSDLMALGAIRAVRDRGLQVPTDISVVGYDDSPLIAFTDPPLTTIRQPVAAMAQAAVRALVDDMNGQSTPPAEYVFQPEFVLRGSTAPPAA